MSDDAAQQQQIWNQIQTDLLNNQEANRIQQEAIDEANRQVSDARSDSAKELSSNQTKQEMKAFRRSFDGDSADATRAFREQQKLAMRELRRRSRAEAGRKKLILPIIIGLIVLLIVFGGLPLDFTPVRFAP